MLETPGSTPGTLQGKETTWSLYQISPKTADRVGPSAGSARLEACLHGGEILAERGHKGTQPLSFPWPPRAAVPSFYACQ